MGPKEKFLEPPVFWTLYFCSIVLPAQSGQARLLGLSLAVPTSHRTFVLEQALRCSSSSERRIVGFYGLFGGPISGRIQIIQKTESNNPGELWPGV